MRDCNRFINAVLENKLLRSCELVELFLTKNPEDFHVIKLRYKNLPTLAIKDYHSLTGNLDLTYYNDNYHSPEFNLQKIERKRNILKEINTNLKNAISCMDNLNKYMENLSKLFFDLEKEYKSKDYTFDSLETLARLCKNLSCFCIDKKNFWDFKIREFFKYINLELKEIKNLCNDSKYAKINLEKCENCIINFQNDKNNKFKTQEILNYELQKKHIEKNTAQRTSNLLRNKTFEELQRIMNIHYIRFKNYFSQTGAIISNIYTKEYNLSLQIINCFNCQNN
jgi:hypothetical protein